MTKETLMKMAEEAAKKSYSPYSHFRVGAALLCSDGSVETGTNVENRSFGLTICAERSAMVSAVSNGKQEFTMLALDCPDADYPVSPCGACRQFIMEFVAPDFPVIYKDGKGHVVETTAGELLPSDALHDLKK